MFALGVKLFADKLRADTSVCPYKTQCNLGAVGANLRVRPWCEIIFRQIKGRHVGLPLQNPLYLGAVGANLRVRPWCEIIFFTSKAFHCFQMKKIYNIFLAMVTVRSPNIFV